MLAFDVAISTDNTVSVNDVHTTMISIYGIAGSTGTTLQPFMIQHHLNHHHYQQSQSLPLSLSSSYISSCSLSLCPNINLSLNSIHAGLNSIMIRPDGELIATAGWDHRIRIFRCPISQPIRSIKENINNYDSKASSNTEITEKPPIPLAILHFHTAAVQSISFTPSRRGGEGRDHQGRIDEMKDMLVKPASSALAIPRRSGLPSTSSLPLGVIAASLSRSVDIDPASLFASGGEDHRIAIYSLYPNT